MTLDPQVQEILDRLNAATPQLARPRSLDELRAAVDAAGDLLDGTPPAVPAADLQIARDDRTALPLRVYRPDARVPLPVLVWYHGGGFVLGSLRTADSICRRLAHDIPAVVVSVDYRLGPDHSVDETLADVDRAIDWAAANASLHGGDARRLAVGGDSAGGHLATAAALRARDRGGPRLAMQLLVYPVTDIPDCMAINLDPGNPFAFPWGISQWLRGRDPASAAVSPVHADLRGLPPAHLVLGSEDFLIDQDRSYASALRAAGVAVGVDEHEGMPHGFFSWDCGIAASLDARAAAVAALRRALTVTRATPSAPEMAS